MVKRKKRAKARKRKKAAPKSLSPSNASRARDSDPSLSDPSGRGYPPASERRRIIDSIRDVPSAERTVYETYQLGSLLVYEACLENDDDLLNEGNEALVLAANMEPPHPDAIMDLTWLLNLRGLPAMALPYAKRATELAASREDAWRFRANTHLQLKQKDEALECLRNAVALPGAAAESKETLSMLTQDPSFSGGIGVLCFSKSFQRSALDGNDERREEQIKMELFYARQILRIKPDDSATLFMAALGNYHLKRFKEAELYLSQLLTVEESHADGLCMQGLIHTKRDQDPEKARSCYERAILADPSHLLATTNLAKILLDFDGKIHLAKHLLETVLETADETNHHYPNALSMYGNTVGSTEQDYQRESEYHLKAIKLASDQPNFRLSYVLSLLQAGAFQQLRKAWKKHGPILVKWSDREHSMPLLTLTLMLVPAILDPPSDFEECVSLAQELGSHLGGVAVQPLLYQAQTLIKTFPKEQNIRLEAMQWLGVTAGNLKLDSLSLQLFKAAHQESGGKAETACNLAATLSLHGQHDEAIKLALSVPVSVNRAATIQGNVLAAAGKKEQALQRYIQAIESDYGFSLPISNGVDVAIKLGNMEALERLAAAVNGDLAKDPRAQLAYAKAKIALGFPTQAADFLKSHLYVADEPMFVSKPAAVLEDGNVPVAEPSEDDLLFTLGVAFLKSRQFESLQRLGDWMLDKREINGNWKILFAEANRYLGLHQQALEIMDGMQSQPPPLLTKALIYSAAGDWRVAREAVNSAHSKEFANVTFAHPEGNPNAVGHAVKSLNMSDQGYPQDAIEEALRAVQCDCTCGIAYLSLAKAYADSDKPELAIPAAVDALLKVPGDQGLVDWLVTRLIEHGEPIRAGEVLEANRESLISRGNSELAYFLGEQIALAKLGKQKLVEPEVKGRWISRLEQDSQAWLTDALSYREKVSGLKLGIAMYYCKIVECELTNKLIVPFIESEPVFDKHQFDSELKGLRDCFNSGWMTLGSIAHSLRVACSSPGASDTALMLAWRSYLNNLPEPQKSAVRDDHFLKTLGMLSRVRNRIAHLGNLNDEEFDNVQNTVFADGEAGSVLQRLGIS